MGYAYRMLGQMNKTKGEAGTLDSSEGRARDFLSGDHGFDLRSGSPFPEST